MAPTAAPMAAKPVTTKRNDSHVMIFPFLAKGHTIPLLHLSAALARRGFKVTLLTTPGNYPLFHSSLGLPQPGIHVTTLPFPAEHRRPPVPPGCESTDQLLSFQHYRHFLHTTKHLDSPFRDTMQAHADAGDLPLCLVSDLFHWWSRPVCAEFGVPWVAFTGMGMFGMTLMRYLFVNPPIEAIAAGPEGEFQVPDMPEGIRLKVSDLPFDILRPDDSPFAEFVAHIFGAETKAWGILVNSVATLEPEQYVPLLESFYRNGSRAWLVGPLALYPCGPSRAPGAVEDPPSPDDDPCLRWLDGKPPGSVLYVSFGTQSDVSDEQLDEVLRGLEMAGHDFLWAARSATWAPPVGTLERLEAKNQGMICRRWAPQREVLAHPSTGGFLSHCGWNSVMEAVSAGVPILAWPFLAEQPLNAKYVVDVARIGLRLERSLDGAVLRGEAVCGGVRELMGGVEGEEVRKKVAELRTLARGAVEDGGSSATTLDQFLQHLRTTKIMQKNKDAAPGPPETIISPVH